MTARPTWELRRVYERKPQEAVPASGCAPVQSQRLPSAAASLPNLVHGTHAVYTRINSMITKLQASSPRLNNYCTRYHLYISGGLAFPPFEKPRRVNEHRGDDRRRHAEEDKTRSKNRGSRQCNESSHANDDESNVKHHKEDRKRRVTDMLNAFLHR